MCIRDSQAQEAVAEEATRAGMPYINQRWLGGLLTNWVTVQKSVKDVYKRQTCDRSKMVPVLTV